MKLTADADFFKNQIKSAGHGMTSDVQQLSNRMIPLPQHNTQTLSFLSRYWRVNDEWITLNTGVKICERFRLRIGKDLAGYPSFLIERYSPAICETRGNRQQTAAQAGLTIRAPYAWAGYPPLAL